MRVLNTLPDGATSTKPGRSMTTAHRAHVRDELLQAAEKLFSSVGYVNVTHADIAFEADIGRTTFYEYFTSKEDVLVQLVEERLPRIATEMVDGLPDDLGPTERLGELTQRMIQFVAVDPLGSLLHTDVQLLSQQSQAQITKTHTKLSAEFAAVYRAGVADGAFKEMAGDVASRLIFEVIMAAGRVLKESADPKQRVHEVADTVTGFLLAGLRRDAPS